MPRIIEIRSYNLKPDTRAEFDRIARTVVRPMLVKHGMDVVALGPSMVDTSTYFLIRAYNDAADREASQSTFYGGDAWKEGPRDAILACIASYATVVIEADETTINGLRDIPAVKA
ncbi:MAG: NIPSNAP family protein [Usitatibacteraceae bacterium]